MPDPTIYTFIPPVLNKPVRGLLDSGQTIRTNRIVMLEESTTARTLFGPHTGYFATTASGRRYTLIVLPVSALHAWLAEHLGVSTTVKEVLPA